ncbi:hypothetical protein ONZ45_g15266 [Pleurotus djamor]|nr:hypothetical protein ONZ45_g15266 [Pleurotus djamor]
MAVTSTYKPKGSSFESIDTFFERESEKLRAKLATPASPGKQRQGESDSTAILLPDVTADDLEKFLWVFYNPKHSLYAATFEDWSAILRLAHRWEFPEVKALCLRELEAMKMPLVDRLVLYQAHQVADDVLIPRYCQLCARDEMLTMDEGQRLGMATTLLICTVREQLRSSAADGLKSPLPPNLKTKDVFAAIKSAISGKPVESTDKPSPAPILKDPKPKTQNKWANGESSKLKETVTS